MASPSCSDDEFISLFTEHGPIGTARILGIDVRNVHLRRANLEKKRGLIAGPDNRSRSGTDYPKRLIFNITDGIALIGSDAHYWPGIVSTAHRAFVQFAKELKPAAIILNGDVLDGAKISRHPPLGWKHVPKVQEELEAVDERLDEIRLASPKSKRFWLLGNHCMRFDARLAMQNPEYGGVIGSCLKDHFPHWDMGLSLWINQDTVVKHRYKGGVHATHNNTVTAGKSIFTGHLHSLKVTPFDDYNGTRFGVDTGTLADPRGEQFDYAEENPLNHRSGFIVVTFHKGKMLWPEIAAVIDENHVQFRGKVIQV